MKDSTPYDNFYIREKHDGLSNILIMTIYCGAHSKLIVPCEQIRTSVIRAVSTNVKRTIRENFLSRF